MRAIYKYPLELDLVNEQTLSVPTVFKPLYVGHDGDGQLCLWAEVDKTCRGLQFYPIRVRGTGHPLGDAAQRKYLGTSVAPNGFVWHVFGELES